MAGNSTNISVAKNLVTKHLRRAMNGNTPDPLFLHSAPGLGKSSIVKQAANEFDIPVVDIRVSALDPADVQGVPFIDQNEGEMKFSTPEWMDRCQETNYGILFLDEISNAPMAVQGAAYRIVLDREVQNGTKLPEGWVVIAAGNRAEDKSGAKNISSALANRFGLHLNVEPDKDSVTMHGVAAGWDERVIGFLEFAPNMTYQKPQTPQDTSFPTPRSWDAVSNHLLADDLNEFETHLCVAGCVGEQAASQFMSYMKHYLELPNWDKVRKGEKYNVDTDNLGLCFAVTTSLVYVALADAKKNNQEYLNNLCDVLRQLGNEYHILFFKLIKEATTTENNSNKIITNLIMNTDFKDLFNEVRQYLPSND